MKYKFVTDCVSVQERDVPFLHEMIEKARDITYRTFFRYVDLALVARWMGYSLDKRQGLTLKHDWHISYHSSIYKGRKCVYMRHSAIEYIFQAPWENG